MLLPYSSAGEVDWPSFRAHLARTAEAGLTPAVNMDTGYVNLLDDATKADVLRHTHELLSGAPFVAGAFVADQPGDPFAAETYNRQIEMIQEHGGTPVIFQSYGLIQRDSEGILDAYREVARNCDRFIGFELTTDIAPFGAVYDLETYAGLLDIPQCIGAKHSSFHREPEWQRILLRNEKRPEFTIYTGNDYGIDMVMYGSDYLLGLSTFAPDLFAKRDAYWETGDPAFYELNDLLQYLGFFAFRNPGAAYKHSAAQFLKLRGWITSDRTHPNSSERPASDVDVLRELGKRLEII